MDEINKYMEDCWSKKQKGIITEEEYSAKIDVAVEINLFIQGCNQDKKGGLWTTG